MMGDSRRFDGHTANGVLYRARRLPLPVTFCMPMVVVMCIM